MLHTINDVGHSRYYVLPTIMFANTNNCFLTKDRYSSLIFQHTLENILNVSKRFIKLLHQPTKPHGLFRQFPNKQKRNKEAYDSIDAFLHQLK